MSPPAIDAPAAPIPAPVIAAAPTAPTKVLPAAWLIAGAIGGPIGPPIARKVEPTRMLTARFPPLRAVFREPETAPATKPAATGPTYGVRTIPMVTPIRIGAATRAIFQPSSTLALKKSPILKNPVGSIRLIGLFRT